MIGEWSILSENGTHKYEFAGTEWLNPQGDSVTPFVSEDATEKVLILHKMAQDKVYLCVLRYYILYAKTVFQ